MVLASSAYDTWAAAAGRNPDSSSAGSSLAAVLSLAATRLLVAAAPVFTHAMMVERVLFGQAHGAVGQLLLYL